MKRAFILLALFFFAAYTKSQDIERIVLQQATFPGSGTAHDINCTPRQLTGCNYITNNNFTPDPSYDPFNNDQHMLNPFGNTLVPDWIASHGTPQITDGVWDFNATPPYWVYPPSTPPSPATGFAYAISFPNVGGVWHEGFAQKIPPLTVGKKYMFSFFDKLPIRPPNGALPVQSYKIILMKCTDATAFTYPAFTIPVLPANSYQTIVCRANINNSNWQQYVSEFTALQDFDIIWFYPDNTPNGYWTGSDIAYPELIDVQNFSAGPDQSPISRKLHSNNWSINP